MSKLSLPILLKERKLFYFIGNAQVRGANLLRGLVSWIVLWLSLTTFTLIKYFFLEIDKSNDFGKKNIFGIKNSKQKCLQFCIILKRVVLNIFLFSKQKRLSSLLFI